jgi:iron complex transport system ATP-binding protein
LVTHHLPDVIPEIGRVIALKEGRIFFDGPKREALTGPRMSELFDHPVEVDAVSGIYSFR